MPARYRAEQVGSLLRPAQLLQARASYAALKIPLEELRAKEDDAIRQALEQQRRVWIYIFSEGEMGRGSWGTEMAEAREGFVPPAAGLESKGPRRGRERRPLPASGGKHERT